MKNYDKIREFNRLATEMRKAISLRTYFDFANGKTTFYVVDDGGRVNTLATAKTLDECIRTFKELRKKYKDES